MAEARILYLATADGLIQLANPGKSGRWREVGRALQGQPLRAVVASPADPLVAFAAGPAGIARTTSGGMSWETVQAEPATTLALDASGTLYAGTARGVVLSSADGAIWSEADAFSAPVVQIVVVDDATVLSVGADGTVCQREQDRWQQREIHVPHVRGVAASHAQPSFLFVVNGTSLATPLGAHRLPAAPTGAVLVLSGDPEVVLIGTAAALLRSDDAGRTTAEVDGPQNVTVLVSPPRFVDQAFAGTAAGELWFSSDRGRSWSVLRSGDAPLHGIGFARAL